MSKFFEEFKAFAMKGNVIDMAVGVVIGGAFGKIVTSLVSDVIMPLVGALCGGVNFTDWKLVVSKAVMEGGEIVKPAVTVNYGNLLQVIFDFLIIAFCIFLVIRSFAKMKDLRNKRKEQETVVEEPAAPAPKPEDIALLEEIRDLLKNNK